jgi:rhodanese-related sulfurtransferase/DNA-binding transcriptional ArsR family regulator
LASTVRSTKTRAELYDSFAIIGKALASGRRLEILDYLNQGPRSVSQLADELNQSVANTSQHLHVLLEAGLVSSHRNEQRVVYALSRPEIGELLSAVCDLAVEELPTAAQRAMSHLGDRGDVGSVSYRELARRIRTGEVVIIDVRPEIDYRAAHIAGAVWVPEAKIRSFARSVNPDVEVVAYCRGEYCALADIAVRELQHLGIQARRLEGGFPQWVARGGAHERSA